MTTLLAALPLVFAATAAPAPWTVDAAGSALRFRSAYEGEAFEGRFTRFTANVRFDPSTPQAARFDVLVDLSSASTEVAERDEMLQGADFFDVAAAKQARFTAKDCAAAGAAGRFRCVASLTLRGKTAPVGFEFDWKPVPGGATLAATSTVDRLAFGVGGGDWADPALIPKDVAVSATLRLRAP